MGGGERGGRGEKKKSGKTRQRKLLGRAVEVKGLRFIPAAKSLSPEEI